MSDSQHPDRHPAFDRRNIWLEETVLAEDDPARIAETLIDLLRECDLPLLRVNIAVASLHPEIIGFAHIWSRGTNRIESIAGDRDYFLSPEIYGRSPFRLVAESGASGVRRRLERSDCLVDLDVIDELRAEGATDYVVIAIGNQHAGSGTFTSWTTDRPGGFTTPELVAIAEHTRLMAHLLAALASRQTARNLVTTYIGRRAGARVLAGDIVRGQSSNIEAAIWLSDIRDFTGLSERLPADRLLALLNQHFDMLIKPVHGHGGEVLKLVGDAVLAIFPAAIEGGAEAACAAALAAAQEAREASGSAAAEPGDEAIRYAVALHFGTVSYGNVGASNRLDFTVIGPAVNLASRLNALAKDLDRDIVLSQAFAARCPAPAAMLGTYQLRGLAGAHDAFAPTDPRP